MAGAFLARQREAKMGLALAVHVKGFCCWLRCALSLGEVVKMIATDVAVTPELAKTVTMMTSAERSGRCYGMNLR
jgi:hypothetical protein